MVRKLYALFLLISGMATVSFNAVAEVNLNEELSSQKDEFPAVITQSASLSEAQKKSIQVALAKMFGEQIASTSVYSEIVRALVAAMATEEVTQSSKKFVAGLKDLVKVFFKNMKLSDEQLAKIRDLLETIKALAVVQMKHFDPQTIDDTIRNHIITLQERLTAHVLPLNAGMQSVLSQETIDLYQKQIVQLILDLIKDVLAILPAGPQISGAGNPPLLAEPVVPEHLEIQDGLEG